MILPFKPRFVEPIKAGTKIHTLRADPSNRWREGLKIHMATGVRTKNYKQFNEKTCNGIQYVEIVPKKKAAYIKKWNADMNEWLLVPTNVELLAKNDGFETVEAFWEWFDQPFEGKIIHWTDFRY